MADTPKMPVFTQWAQCCWSKEEFKQIYCFHLSLLLHHNYFCLHFNQQYLISLKKPAERWILDIQDFQVTDVLGEKSPIIVGPKSQPPSDENLHEDTPLPSFSQLMVKPSALDLDTEYVCYHSQHQAVSLQSYHLDYIIKCDHPDSAPLLPCQTHEAESYFPQEGNASGQDRVFHVLRQTGDAVNWDFHEILASEDSFCFSQMDCVAEYMANSPFLEKSDVETARGQTDCSYLLCEADYISNSGFTAKATDEHSNSTLHPTVPQYVDGTES